MFSYLKTKLADFAADERGSLSIEAAMMAPLLVFTMSITYQGFDIFAIDSTMAKASNTLGDLVSRETLPLNQTYIDGLKTMFLYLTNSNRVAWVRVTSVKYVAANAPGNKHVLQWSKVNTGAGVVPLTQTTFNANVLSRMPTMRDGEYHVVIESTMEYTPFMTWGIIKNKFYYTNFDTREPRFVTKTCWVTIVGC